MHRTNPLLAVNDIVLFNGNRVARRVPLSLIVKVKSRNRIFAQYRINEHLFLKGVTKRQHADIHQESTNSRYDFVAAPQ